MPCQLLVQKSTRANKVLSIEGKSKGYALQSMSSVHTRMLSRETRPHKRHKQQRFSKCLMSVPSGPLQATRWLLLLQTLLDGVHRSSHAAIVQCTQAELTVSQRATVL